MPALGTCAGMILLADRIEDGTAGQETLGGLDVTVRRNAFGRQVDSFETELDFAGLAEPVHAVFIRAPWVEEVGDGRRGPRPGPGEPGTAAPPVGSSRSGRGRCSPRRSTPSSGVATASTRCSSRWWPRREPDHRLTT